MTHPERLGKYRITGVLGDGAMGVVYRGFDPDINRPVAIKTIHRKLVDDDGMAAAMTARFRNEAQAVGRLLHPAVVAIHEYGEDAGTVFIAMEFVEGRSLAQVLAATPLLPEPQVLRIMDQLLDALECAHRAGVWHRDVKPANLLLTNSGQLKVTDFGISRIENVELTKIDSVIGSPGYMAPEQYAGPVIDHRIDIFAAGVLFYRLLAGVAPFAGSYEQVMYQVLNEDPKPPGTVGPMPHSVRFDAVVAKALAKNPAHRFASALEFRQAIARVAGHELVDEDATVVWPAGADKLPVPAPSVAPGRAAGTGTSPTTTGTTQSPTPGWDPATLGHIERTLAGHVGPMARVLVRQAARTTQDLTMLAHALSGHVDIGQRDAFVAHAQSVPGATLAPRSGGTGSMGSASNAGSEGVARAVTTARTITTLAEVPSAADAEAAERALTLHMGPIARVMVKRALASARSRGEFLDTLAGHLQEAKDRARFLAELKR